MEQGPGRVVPHLSLIHIFYVSALSDRIANLRVDFRDTTPEPATTMFPYDQGILPADLPAEIMGKVYSKGGYGNLAPRSSGRRSVRTQADDVPQNRGGACDLRPDPHQ